MDYFCYISRTKIDQLYGALPGVQGDTWSQTESTTHDLETSASGGISLGNILELFKGGITYGRKGVVQREREVKVQYVNKLRDVLISIARENPIPDLGQALADGPLAGIYHSCEGDFKTDSPVIEAKSNHIVTLRGSIGSYTLYLDCSLRFFSEGNEPDGRFLIHSGNMRFFSGQIALTLSTVLVLLRIENESVFASPLFLRLSTSKNQDSLPVRL